MRLRLSLEERIVLKFLQSEEHALPAIAIADRIGLENHEAIVAIDSPAEKNSCSP